MPQRRHDSNVTLLTGPSRSGKTTVCRAVIAAAAARGLAVAGVLTEDATGPGGARRQIALDLRTGRRRLLARARDAVLAPATAEHKSAEARPAPRNGVPTHGWEFQDDGVAFGRAVLEESLVTPCDLLVIDQLGPLELVEGRGWSIAFDLLSTGSYGLALVVVNPRVLDRAVQLIGACTVHHVTQAQREALPAMLAAGLPPRRP